MVTVMCVVCGVCGVVVGDVVVCGDDLCLRQGNKIKNICTSNIFYWSGRKERYLVKPLEVHSLLRIAGRRRERRRRPIGDGNRTISTVTSSLLQCWAVTNQSAVQ